MNMGYATISNTEFSMSTGIKYSLLI